jgi:hypothetical protein
MPSREMQSRERGHTGHARQQVTRHFLFVILLFDKNAPPDQHQPIQAF